jgi:biotin carboxyl carrier protein
MIYEVVLTARDGTQRTFSVEGAGNSWRVNGKQITVDAVQSANALSLLSDGRSFESHKSTVGGEQVIEIGGQRFTMDVRDPRSLKSRRRAGSGQEGPMRIKAPMPGKVVRVIAAAGTEVKAGDGVIVIEAMKMQNELKAPKAGKIAKVNVKDGDTVNPGDTLAVVE